MSSMQLFDFLTKTESNKNEIHLKFDITSHKQNQHALKLKGKKHQKSDLKKKDKRLVFSLIKQLSCILEEDEQLVEEI